jgi:hypothetical protein
VEIIWHGQILNSFILTIVIGLENILRKWNIQRRKVTTTTTTTTITLAAKT